MEVAIKPEVNGATPLPQRPKNQSGGGVANKNVNIKKPQNETNDGSPAEKKARFNQQNQNQNQGGAGVGGQNKQGFANRGFGNRNRGGNRGGQQPNRGNFQQNQNQQQSQGAQPQNQQQQNAVKESVGVPDVPLKQESVGSGGQGQGQLNQNRNFNRGGGGQGGGGYGGGQGGDRGGNRDRNRSDGGRGGGGDRDSRGMGGGGRGGQGGGGPRSDEFFIAQRLRAIQGPTFELPPIEATGETKFSGRNRLYVGNLTNDITEEELREMFKPYGEIGELFCNPEKNFTFLKLDYRNNCERAKRELDGSMRKGRQLRVRFAPNATILRVSNLNPCVSNELLYRSFEVFGPVERANVVVDDRGKSTGEGIIEFEKKSSANACLRFCNEKCFFLTSSLRPCVVEQFEVNDDTDGLPEKAINKKTQEYQHERSNGPRFADPGSFEHEYGTRWKQLHELYKTKQDALKRELKMEEEKLEAQMEYARYEHETDLLRQELRKRESDNERKKMEWEMREKQAEEMRKRDEENMHRQQTEMQSRMIRQEEEMRRRQQENTLFMQAQQLNSLLDQQEGGFGGSGGDNSNNFDNFPGGAGGVGGGANNSPFQFRDPLTQFLANAVGGAGGGVGGSGNNSGPNNQQEPFAFDFGGNQNQSGQGGGNQRGGNTGGNNNNSPWERRRRF